MLNLLHKACVAALLLPIFLWQKAISPWLGDHCRFYPSCSQYAVEALRTHGIFKGCFLTIKRISRCHPWCEGGIDPVPGSKESVD